jgi:hypothetical protein
MSHSPNDGGPKRGPGDAPASQDEPQGSGEGAQTALQALIRKRKLVEHPQVGEPEPPGPPAQS